MSCIVDYHLAEIIPLLVSADYFFSNFPNSFFLIFPLADSGVAKGVNHIQHSGGSANDI